jgi:ferredoxin
MNISLRRVALTASRISSKFQVPCNQTTANNTMYNFARSLSTVAENTIQLNFVDVDGNRATIPALVGQTLLDVAERNEIDLEGPCRGGGDPTEVRRTENWVETTYGEGPTCFYCHVQIPNTFNHLLPEETLEMKEGIKGLWEEEVNTTSRLACMITLDKRHDGMTVYIPDAPPTDVI